MGFIAKQPNGLYCRFSDVVDCLTHYNMTEEEYLKNKEDGQDILNNYLHNFSEVIDKFLTNNMTQEQFDILIKKMGEEPKEKGFKLT